ncbi:hypothetical protein JMN32_14670 [Fulvivirga sp. 29W222]|uniref:Nodulation protein NodU n=1 Tax=Fulvivirga marina TaxID=2494733 RepID=A0A937KCM8_9BACT|nr:carbamoyltransferase N-terminal domain-containing protein [Fulvivirga marina]MBL6447559.1 hypothetical protein [Fulvivirga marina]
MTILGIKFTHDGAISLIDNGKLIFSFEMEKLNNNLRFQSFCLSFEETNLILKEYGYNLNTIDKIVFDGWTPAVKAWQKIQNESSKIKDVQLSGFSVDIELAGYGRLLGKDEDVYGRKEHVIDKIGIPYESFRHISGHFFGAYCTSPFAIKKEDSYILIWDGGMPPQLFHFGAKSKSITNLGHLFMLFGDIYAGFPYGYAPFDKGVKYSYATPGKVMAYIALGNSQRVIVDRLNAIYIDLEVKYSKNEIHAGTIVGVTEEFIKKSKECSVISKYNNEDILASFHDFLEGLLVERISKKVKEHTANTKNLCFAGGSALNIKWNSKIRTSGVFDKIWIPPFPNDSGSALGTACTAMVYHSDQLSLDWDVYKGPEMINNYVNGYNWTNVVKNRLIDQLPFFEKKFNYHFREYKFTLEELAALIHKKGEPILFLNGRAELGPRALGNRSILAPAGSEKMKQLLNEVKLRENYRPVSPICLEEDAEEIFDPGTPDPFMLFDHQIKGEWREKVPAIVHLDHSARLQTVNEKQNKEVYQLLKFYKKHSSIPLLCNTSANLKGRGFFSDIMSAVHWGQVNYIWSDGMLYSKYKL